MRRDKREAIRVREQSAAQAKVPVSNTRDRKSRRADFHCVNTRSGNDRQLKLKSLYRIQGTASQNFTVSIQVKQWAMTAGDQAGER